ncbi:NUMOD4 domain-containing protein [Mammaliicoccus sciuri]|uniref:NUMOD4 domain-containing protein n=1 Tax=Mammaliicoccus sciuri TaxID=1296 RepID=UPI0019527746|nr:NUMOD4 domain-containing protein [Mammaliicoccus sciuri]
MRIIWKDIDGYEGLYKISNHGEVWSERKQGLLKKGEGTSGYHYVSLNKNKKQKSFTVHRLVANNFIENPFEKPCINHIDENKKNNHYSNLEWCTYKENANHGTGNERRKETKKNSLKCKKLCKSIVGVNIDNGEIIEFHSIREANRNGYNRTSIWKCINGKQSIHKRCKWFYKHDFIQGVG